jgi:hypothetical protein
LRRFIATGKKEERKPLGAAYDAEMPFAASDGGSYKHYD